VKQKTLETGETPELVVLCQKRTTNWLSMGLSEFTRGDPIFRDESVLRRIPPTSKLVGFLLASV
jgi:hypothetical protein